MLWRSSSSAQRSILLRRRKAQQGKPLGLSRGWSSSSQLPAHRNSPCRCHQLSLILQLSVAAGKQQFQPSGRSWPHPVHGGFGVSLEPCHCPDPVPSPATLPQKNRLAALPIDTTEPGNPRAIVLLCARLNISAQLLGLHSWKAGRINKTSCRNWRQWGDN